MSDQEQDLTQSVQKMMVQVASMEAELNSLKARAQALPLAAQPSEVSTCTTSTPTSTRRGVLRRLAGGMLIGLAAGGAALTTGSGDSLARTSVNPVSANNKVGAFIVPPGKPLPTGFPTSGYFYGLIATDGNSLDVSNLPGGLYYPAGVLGYTTFGSGVAGYATGGSGFAVYGYSGGSNGVGVYGYANGTNSTGVLGSASGSGCYAGYFIGDVHLLGTLTGGIKSFKIDHPLDPANKYLYHTSVESPDMMNIYNGIVTLDDRGEATVTMPEWFEALNSDYRYQLTALDTASPDLHIAQRLKDKKFRIAGGRPGQEVSWMITGIRQDAYAKAHRSPVEQDKTGDDKGKYIHPELFGQPEEKAIGRPVKAK